MVLWSVDSKMERASGLAEVPFYEASLQFAPPMERRLAPCGGVCAATASDHVDDTPLVLAGLAPASSSTEADHT